MIISWSPIVWLDIFGSVFVLLCAVVCVLRSYRWSRLKVEDIFRQYIFLLTLSITCFAVSRSVGHLVKQILIFNDNKELWQVISPYSGGVNSITFIVVFAFGIYFHRFRKVHLQIEKYKNNLEILVEERTAELAAANISLENEIEERKKTQRKLADEQERLVVTLRSIGDGVLTTDINNRLVLLNKSGEKLTGWKSEDAIGRPLDEVFHITNEKTGERCVNPVGNIMKGGSQCGFGGKAILQSKEGRKINIAESCAPIMDSKSEIVGLVLVFRDITEKVRMEEEQKKIEKLQSVGVLAGGIAHDFNNILAAILGNINLAVMYTKPADKRYTILLEAEKASLRARDLTQQLLTFAKGGDPIKEIASIEEIIRDSASFVMRGSKVKCNYAFDHGLWPVAIDTGQISQVIQNIILNARDAMDDGGFITISCVNSTINKGQIATIPAGKYLVIKIEDTGPGISGDILDKIFDPYFSTKDKGNGLGLAITHSIISKHDGYILVDSQIGKGSSFTIYIPAEISDMLKEDDSTGVSECVASSFEGERTVLLMDDEEMVREVSKNLLEFLGCNVLLAKDGQEAIDIYSKAQMEGSPIDLIIVDLTIPGGMGGEEAAKKIHNINWDAKIVVSSGYSTDPIMANYRKYGFCASISKPYHIEDLEKVIGKLVGEVIP